MTGRRKRRPKNCWSNMGHVW